MSKNKVTFAQSVKEEIAREKDFSFERRKALLSAYLRINGVITIRNKSEALLLKTDNSKVVRYVYERLGEIHNKEDISLQFLKKNSKKTTYLLEINNVSPLFENLGIDYFEGKIPKDIVYNDETIAGYIAGAFLAGGSINAPSTTNYHLEICVNGENYAKWLLKLFGKYKKIIMSPKLIKRREKQVIYFKKSDQISNFLIMIGAPECCFEFEDQRAFRDFMNSKNRVENFDMANMEKASIVGRRQAKEIKYIDDKLGIHTLHNPKKESLCYIRMENKEATLGEIASLMSEEHGYIITKSSVNHMFRSLHDLYIKLLEVKKR